jgi:ferredoxin
MKASVDADVCTGCGLCVDTCPAVFEMNDAVARVLVASVPENALDTCRDAADNCPVEAIKIEE